MRTAAFITKAATPSPHSGKQGNPRYRLHYTLLEDPQIYRSALIEVDGQANHAATNFDPDWRTGKRPVPVWLTFRGSQVINIEERKA